MKRKAGRPPRPEWERFKVAARAFCAADSEDDEEFARRREELRAATVRWVRATNERRGDA